MKKALKIQTSVPEIYMKLPNLNFMNRIVFSSKVTNKAISKIMNKFKNQGIEMEITKLENDWILKKKSNKDINFNVYLMKR